MRMLLVGVYSDGSNSRKLLEDPLLEESVLLDEDDEVELAAFLMARKALRAAHSSFSDFLIVLEPDEE